MPTRNSIGSNIPIEISKGGTNATSFATSNGILKYDGTSLVADAYNTIDSGNRWLKSSQPAFSVFLTAGVNNISGDGTIYGPILFNEALYNVTSSYNSATGLFTAPKTGLYNFNAAAYTNNTENHSRVIIYLSKNGSNIVWQQIVINSSGWAHRYNMRSVELQLTSGDTVAVKWSSEGGAANSCGILGNIVRLECLFFGYLVC